MAPKKKPVIRQTKNSRAYVYPKFQRGVQSEWRAEQLKNIADIKAQAKPKPPLKPGDVVKFVNRAALGQPLPVTSDVQTLRGIRLIKHQKPPLHQRPAGYNNQHNPDATPKLKMKGSKLSADPPGALVKKGGVKALPPAGQTSTRHNLKVRAVMERRAAEAAAAAGGGAGGRGGAGAGRGGGGVPIYPRNIALPPAKAGKVVSGVKAAGPYAAAAVGGLLLGEILKITRNTVDARRKYERNKGLSKYLSEPTAEQYKNAPRLGQASPEDVGNKNSNTVTVGRPPQLKSPAIGAPIHASPKAFGSAYVGSSAATPPRPSTPAQAALAGDPASETYRDGGKGLYQGTQAYRDAVGGSGNPLLNRFRNEMGLDPATGARPQQEGQPQQAAPAAKAEPKMSAQYDGNDEPGRLGQAENPMQALMELLKKNKLKIQVN
jgi:hypothetical protein